MCVCACETTGRSITKNKMSLPYLETGALIIWRLEVKQRQVWHGQKESLADRYINNLGKNK